MVETSKGLVGGKATSSFAISGDKVGVKMTANKTNLTRNFNRMFKEPLNMQEIKEENAE